MNDIEECSGSLTLLANCSSRDENEKWRRCTDGLCIYKDWVCDGIVHCDDNSDESTATCGEDHVVTESLNFFENYFKELLPIKLSKNNSSS